MSFIMGSWKILQRRTYDLLSHKYSFVFVLLGFLTLTVSVIQFGEVWIERNQSDNSFSSFRDNVVGKSLQKKLCQILPIDVVYTWVNGSDPLLQQQMQEYKKSLMTTPVHCQLKHCIPSHMAVFRGWGKIFNFKFQHTKIQIKHPDKSNSLLNFTVVTFSSSNDARRAIVSSLDDDNNISLSHAYWTSDPSVPYTYSFPNVIMVTGLSFDVITNFQQLSPHHFSKALKGEVNKVWIDIESQIMIMEFQNSPPINIAKTNSMTLFGYKVNISRVYLALELPPSWDFQDLAPSRFEDKEELRYSFRSLEVFAPWVRHVYLVTNGQIPYWLNLDNPRLTLLTHEDIFPDRTHLPTFSSPAIESHIHRIPGLSQHFLYLNDDVFFGQEVWPDDFITHARGQKVYLSWPVPDCSESCPWSWIGDGSCDISCNVTECAYDGGDCNPSNENILFNEDFYDEHHMEALDSPLHDHHLVDDSHLDLRDLSRLNDVRRESNETKVLYQVANSSLTHLYSTNHTLESETKGSFDKPTPTVFNYRNIVKVSQQVSNYSYFHTKNTSHKVSVGNYTFQRKWNFNRQLKASNTSNDLSSTGPALKDVTLNKLMESNLKPKKKGESLPNVYNSKSTGSWALKKSKDTFAESLLFVNRLYNNEFGYEVRKVPAHMPHLIDKSIMSLLQNRFPVEWKRTSSHKIRNVEDMQYAFSYFYFLTSEKQNQTISEIFDMFDTDKSGTWSDREIRTLLTKLNDLPLNYYKVVRFEEQIINCSLHTESEHHVATPLYERYQDSKLPVVSKLLISNCGPIKNALLEKFGTCKKYQTEIVKDKNQATTFKMLSSNLSQLVVLLDEIRRDPKKFICLNDNLDPSLEKDNAIVRAVLQDFFESLFPLPSAFELPLEYRNRFLHMSELKAWRSGRAVLRNGIYLCIFILMIFTLLSFFRIECCYYPKRRVRKIYQDV